MIQGKCQQCGQLYYGSALLQPDNENCNNCGDKLLITQLEEKDTRGYQHTKPQKRLIDVAKDWLFLDIEAKELIFVLLSFCDAKLTSICLSMGGFEFTPWMRGWGANAALRMVVAASIMLYLKMRGRTGLLWFGITVLFFIVVWNCCMLLLLLFKVV